LFFTFFIISTHLIHLIFRTLLYHYIYRQARIFLTGGIIT
jgi:hypothetical protein